jgi:hypothetical protein
MDVAEISKNWAKYRCNPAIMPFASMYGYNTTENFNYCINTMFLDQVGGVTGPFTSILQVIVGSSMTFLKNLNSLRMMLATLLGGISKIIQEFIDRFKLIFSQFKITSLRMQILFRRVFATMYSIIYMGLSGVTAGLNFGDTFIFKFIDTFCFAPETPINIIGKGVIAIKDVRLGDVCAKNGARVLSTYQFQADGQPMVYLNGIEVSTNHYVRHLGRWIPAGMHPEAFQCGAWDGGKKRPLICLDTDKHEIPIGNYIFSDWDETSESDESTMILAEQVLNNGRYLEAPRKWLYQPSMDASCVLKMKSGNVKNVGAIKCEDELEFGKVVGVGKRHVYEWLELPTGEKITPSTLLWYGDMWKRAGHLYPDCIKKSRSPMEMYTLVVFNKASIETVKGTIMRDMCEVHSPDMENPTSNKMETSEPDPVIV